MHADTSYLAKGALAPLGRTVITVAQGECEHRPSQLRIKGGPTACFCQRGLGTRPRPSIHVWSRAAITLPWQQGVVAPGMLWSTGPELLTVQPFKKEACPSPFYTELSPLTFPARPR